MTKPDQDAEIQELRGEVGRLRELVEGFARIDPADEGAWCVACGGVAEPSEWARYGGPPRDTGPPSEDLVFVPAGERRRYGWWHEPACPWLRAYRLVEGRGPRSPGTRRTRYRSERTVADVLDEDRGS